MLSSKPLTPEDLSEMTGLTVRALEKRRSRGQGPAWFKPPDSRRVFYRPEDVDAWLHAGQRGPRS